MSETHPSKPETLQAHDHLWVHATNRFLFPIIHKFGLFSNAMTIAPTPQECLGYIPMRNEDWGVMTVWRIQPGDISYAHLKQYPVKETRFKMAYELIKMFRDQLEKENPDAAKLFGPALYQLGVIYRQYESEGQIVNWLPPDRLDVAIHTNENVRALITQLKAAIENEDRDEVKNLAATADETCSEALIVNSSGYEEPFAEIAADWWRVRWRSELLGQV